MAASFWSNRTVFLTGHTGFKGAWLSLWLHALGARVHGYALAPPDSPNLYRIARVGEVVQSVIGDVRDQSALDAAFDRAEPEIVFHMAAQPLVRASYREPAATFEVNVMGTVRLLESVRRAVARGLPVRAVIIVTTDKCYENMEWVYGYRETDRLGGHDPYSGSKAAAELVTSAYRSSFFPPSRSAEHGVGIASVRAGNVIGGGDWAADRLIPDVMRALLSGRPFTIRNPQATRPWQHVLEPLAGYLRLARLLADDGARYSGAWNFGPGEQDARTVEWMVTRLLRKWREPVPYTVRRDPQHHEARYLKLDCAKARSELGWRPVWNADQALDRIVEWYEAYENQADMQAVCFDQIAQYSRALEEANRR
jgi:CDP-glucose 4,6-dehydratase